MQTYRPDIDGLRAIAVAAVILNHAHVPGFGGGFLGVDIFFVISGFLITNILVRSDGGLGENILQFYERRVRRIVPALAAVMAACTVAALIILSPYELKQFAESLIASTGFAANLHFMYATDYFAPKLETPLLHLWSLGVEEQFYIVYPLFLWAMARHARHFLRPALVVIFLLSLGLSEWLAEHHARYAFFFTGSRAWELMLGALVALYPLRRTLPKGVSEVLASVALFILIIPIPLFDGRTLWPGIHALLPCAGTALLLALHDTRQTAVSRLLSLRPLVAVGLISYSLYLWHWPFFEFYQRWVLRTPTMAEFAMLIAASIVAAALSWRFIEQPFRRTGGIGKTALFGMAGLSGMILLSAGALALASDGFPQRFAPPIRRIYAYLDTRQDKEFRKANNGGTCFLESDRERYPFDKCFTLSASSPNVVLWGDSMARNVLFGFRQEAGNTNVNIIQATYASCRPVIVAGGRSPSCLTFNREIFNHLNDKIAAVVLSGLFYNSPELLPALDETVRRIAAKGIRVIVLGPMPMYPEPVPLYVARYAETGDARVLAHSQSLLPRVRELDARMRGMFQGQTGVVYISVLDAMCDGNRCPVLVGGAPINFDEVHTTLRGSRLFGKALWPEVYAAVPVSSPPPDR